MKMEPKVKSPRSPVSVASSEPPVATGLSTKDQLHALIYEALETEKGGVLVYETAIRCAINDELRKEWQKYLDQTRNHVKVLMAVLAKLGLNPDQETPGRTVVRFNGTSLVRTMEIALMAGKPDAAQMVAAECVVLAETKDHMNWQLIGAIAGSLSGAEQQILQSAYEEVEHEEDEHLYHTTGWARELHLQALGLPAQLPPVEEQDDVTDEMQAAQVRKERKETLTNQKGARSEEANRQESTGVRRTGANKQKRQSGRSAA